MRWFDFLFGKPRPASDASTATATRATSKAERAASRRSRTRCAHYTFAHYALRMVALDRPLLFFAEMASPQATEFLEAVFKLVEQDCCARNEPPDFSAADLKVHTGRLVNYPLVVIEMPPPLAMTEAYYIGVVLLIDVDQNNELVDKPPVRYFTLERTIGENETPTALLCEWTETMHAQCGACPISFDDFVREIMGRM